MNLPELQASYPYQKPGINLQLIALGLIASFGLIALFIAAYHAFLLVANPWQAFFAALVIEAGLIVEALALINKPKTIYPWLGLIISYVVSGTYNFTQAAQMGEGLGNWELSALAFGPLSALAVVSLTFGNELRSYQERSSAWTKERAEWVEAEYKRIEQVRIDSEVEQRRADQEAEQRRLEAEQKHTEKMARIEASKNRPNERPKSKQKTVSKEEALSLIVQFLAENSDASLSQIGRQIGRPKSTVGNYVNELIQSGKLDKNGHGWIINN